MCDWGARGGGDWGVGGSGMNFPQHVLRSENIFQEMIVLFFHSVFWGLSSGH